jgi:hypothetical protein
MSPPEQKLSSKFSMTFLRGFTLSECLCILPILLDHNTILPPTKTSGLFWDKNIREFGHNAHSATSRFSFASSLLIVVHIVSNRMTWGLPWLHSLILKIRFNLLVNLLSHFNHRFLWETQYLKIVITLMLRMINETSLPVNRCHHL